MAMKVPNNWDLCDTFITEFQIWKKRTQLGKNKKINDRKKI